MSKIKIGFLVAAILLLTNVIKAQNLEEGKRLFFYEKYTSAKNVLSQIPNNVEATYWLGQTYIATDNVAGAKSLYQQALAANPNSPILIAGMGHIELLEGKTTDARQRFETAISLSGGKNASVLNAVGYANIESKNGDADYAIDKLKLASTLKGMKDPDVYINLGDAYRKNLDGGMAQIAYLNALTFNKNYARALYKTGKIYQTQGGGQRDIVMKYYDDAIAKDPTFPPVYYSLYNYYYSTDVGRSAEYLEKYLTAKGDDEPNACYFRASMKYAQGLFADAITESDKCIAAGGANPFPNLYGLKAYSYNRLKDSINAKLFFDEYFKRQNPDKIEATDYATYANVLLKLPGNDSLATFYTTKAVDMDTTEIGKVTILKNAALYFENQKKFVEAAGWYNKLLSVKKNVTKTDLYNAGYNYLRTGNYTNALSVFSLYTQKFPEDPYGYNMSGKVSWSIDSTMQQGLANPYFEKAIQLGQVDSVKYKTQLIVSYKYFVSYYANIKKDKATALVYCDKILALDPTDAETINNKALIESMKMGTAPKTAPKPVVSESKGEKVVIGADGTVTTTAKDGTVTIISKNGTVTTITKDGKKTVVAPPAKKN
ncbi:MAG: tetratricopeptide repeat protein [Bacteroidota bacterium]